MEKRRIRICLKWNLSLILIFFPVVSGQAQDASGPITRTDQNPNPTAESVYESALNVIFDCSGSMGIPDVETADGRKVRRGDVCRTELMAALSGLKDGAVGVGLQLFGHRSYWAPLEDGGYEVRLSEMGRNQQPESSDVDPSFDHRQEVTIHRMTEDQLTRLSQTLSAVRFHRGAQSPSYQALDASLDLLDQLPATVTSRDILIVTDGFNQLADAEAAERDTTASALKEKIETLKREENAVPIRVHFVLFGEAFKVPAAGDRATFEQNENEVRSLAESSGGTVTKVQTPAELREAIRNVIAGVDRQNFVTVTGEIVRNGQPVGRSSEFTVSLDATGIDPVTTTDGRFRFENIPSGRKYTVKVAGRIRNRSFRAEKKDVEVSGDSAQGPVTVSLDD